MSAAAYLTLGILLAAIVAFATGRWRPDAIALFALIVLLGTGIIDPRAGLAGFGSPVLVAMAAVFVVSAALERVGLAAAIGRRIFRLAGRSELLLILAFGTAGGLLSGFMNSMGAIAVLLPAATATAREARISPSKLLLPLALGARLGGNLTLIAGPSNLIASEALARAGSRPLTLFELLPLGAAFLVVGMAFIALIGRRWLPDVPLIERPTPGRLMDLYRLKERLFEIRIPDDSSLAGKSIAESDLGRAFGVTVVSIARENRRIVAPSRDERLMAGDMLLVEGRIEDLVEARAQEALEVEGNRRAAAPVLESPDIRVVEMILAPRSNLAGKTLKEIRFREKYGATVLAIWREGRPRRTALVDLPVQLGDALLVQGHRERIELLKREPDFLVLEPGGGETPRIQKAPWALLAVAVMIVASTLGVDIAVATLLAAGIAVLTGCLSAEEIYQAIDWRALVFIGAMLSVSGALASTGAAAAIVSRAVSLVGHTPLLALGALLVAGIVVNQVVPSVAAAVLLIPIALQIAGIVGASPRTFVIAVIATTGTTFTPISNPVNLLVMGPGGYRLRDYVRVGLPLAAVLGILSILLLPAVWPLRP